jgi:ElaB/YqjD/DUF883 family membrane-anchored ribosome-binding protein
MADFNTENRGTFDPTTSTTGETVRDKTSKAASRAKESVNEAMETGKRRADEARRSTASGLEKAASWTHDSASHLPGGEKTQRAAHAVADGMNRSATYLRDHSFGDMASDVEGYVRRHPGPSLAIAAAVGFLIGQSLRKSR